jgi:mono/diheme cytochrome c family protein
MAVAVFILFWVIVAVALVFIGLRGGARGAREALQTQSRAGARFTVAVIALVIIGFGIVLPVALLIGNDHNTGRKYQSVKLSEADAHGRTLFAQQCSSCHTLNAAHAAGKVGPNLDQLKPPAALVLNAIETGRMRGNGTMPAGIVSGKDAQDVAAFVGAVAGKTG